MELFSTFAFVPNCLAQFGKITFYSWQTSKIYENQEKKKNWKKSKEFIGNNSL